MFFICSLSLLVFCFTSASLLPHLQILSLTGVVIGPFVEGAGWCVEWNMEELSPSTSLEHFKFGSYVDGTFKTEVEIRPDMFDLGGGKGVRLCGCAGKVNAQGVSSCGSCRIAQECGDATSGGTGSGLGGGGTSNGGGGGGGGTSNNNNKGGGTSSSSNNNQGTSTAGNGKNQNGNASKVPSSSAETNDDGLIVTGIILGVTGCCCCVMVVAAAILLKRQKNGSFSTFLNTLTKKSTKKKKRDTKGFEMMEGGLHKNHIIAGPGSILAREELCRQMEGSQWWYFDLEGVEQGPFESNDMIGWAEWDYLNTSMWVFEIRRGTTEEEKMELQYVELGKSRLASFVGMQVQTQDSGDDERRGVQEEGTAAAIAAAAEEEQDDGYNEHPEALGYSNPMNQKNNQLSKKMSVHPISKPRGTMLPRGKLLSKKESSATFGVRPSSFGGGSMKSTKST